MRDALDLQWSVLLLLQGRVLRERMPATQMYARLIMYSFWIPAAVHSQTRFRVAGLEVNMTGFGTKLS